MGRRLSSLHPGKRELAVILSLRLPERHTGPHNFRWLYDLFQRWSNHFDLLRCHKHHDY
jgi:hypothetical protein